MTMTSPGRTRTTRLTTPTPPASFPCWDLELAARQLRAVELFTGRLRAAEEAVAAPGRSSETRRDAARRMDVLRRQHQAVVARAHAQLRATGDVLHVRPGAARIVLAHRSAWFLDRVAAALEGAGLDVVARLDGGAEAVGLSVCEQPDLVLVEDTLTTVPGEEVVRELVDLCPQSRVVAQCAYGDRVGPLLEAGAAAVFTRQVPPADVAAAVAQLLG